MAGTAGRGRGRRALTAVDTEEKEKKAARTSPHAGWFVILRVDELGTEPTETDAVKIGEKLTVIRVMQGKPNQGSDSVAREHRKDKEAEWAKAREVGSHSDFPDGLPDHFPRHNYRAIPLGSFVPGHFAEETRQAAFGTF